MRRSWIGALVCAGTFWTNANAATGDEGAVEEIIITAIPLGGTEDQLVQPTDVINAQELARKRRTTIGETLENQPGVSTTDFGAGAGRPVIRGQAGPRVAVLENGIASMDASDVSTDHAVTIDPSYAEQVEVLKGPATLLYGGGASAGVINVVGERLPTRVTDGLHGTASGYLGSNASDKLGTAEVGFGAGRHMFHGDFTSRDADDYDIPGNATVDGAGSDGDLANSAVRSHSGSISYGWVGDAAGAAMSVSRFETTYGLPVEETAFIDMNQTRVDVLASLEAPVSFLELVKLRGGYTDYDHTEFEAPGEPGTVFENEQSQIRLEAVHVPLGGWRGAFGLQHDYRDLSAIGDESFIPPVVTRNVGVFLVEERPYAGGKLELGARVQRDETDPDTASDRSFTPLSFSAGTAIEIGESHHLKLYATRAQRSPVAEELYAFGPHGATATFERGDGGLDEEAANNFEVALDGHGERAVWEVNVYYEKIEDYIVLQEVDLGLNADGRGVPDVDGEPDFVDDAGQFDPAGELLLVDYNAADAEFYGVEAQLEYILLSAPFELVAQLFADKVIGELDSDDNLPRITPARYGLALNASDGAWSGDIGFTHVTSKDNLASLETDTDGYDMLTAGLSYRFGSEGAGVEVYVQGRNLLDEEVRRATSFLKDVAPAPGLSVLAGLRLSF